jgi:hypothetical protein
VGLTWILLIVNNRIRQIIDPGSSMTWIGWGSKSQEYPAQQRFYTITSDQKRGDRVGRRRDDRGRTSGRSGRAAWTRRAGTPGGGHRSDDAPDWDGAYHLLMAEARTRVAALRSQSG